MLRRSTRAIGAVALLAGIALAAEPEMLRVPAGTFTMGRDDGPVDERPAHRVTVAAFDVPDPDARIHRRAGRFLPDPGFEDGHHNTGFRCARSPGNP